MLSLIDNEFLSDNGYVEGNQDNTYVGQTVWVKGMEGWDEVLHPNIVVALGESTITCYEDNPVEAIPPAERGNSKISQWYIKG